MGVSVLHRERVGRRERVEEVEGERVEEGQAVTREEAEGLAEMLEEREALRVRVAWVEPLGEVEREEVTEGVTVSVTAAEAVGEAVAADSVGVAVLQGEEVRVGRGPVLVGLEESLGRRGEGEALALGVVEAEGDGEAEGEREMLGEGVRESVAGAVRGALGERVSKDVGVEVVLVLGQVEGCVEAEGDCVTLAVGEAREEPLGLTDTTAERENVGVTEGHGEALGERVGEREALGVAVGAGERVVVLEGRAVRDTAGLRVTVADAVAGALPELSPELLTLSVEDSVALALALAGAEAV